MAEDQKQEEQREVVALRNERGETRNYETVASRLNRFRAQFPDHALLSEVFKDDGDSIAIKAQIGFYLPSGQLVILAEGHAQEFHDASTINRTACMENAETSAWGRALAAFGFAGPTSVASADEVEKAKRREAELKNQDSREPGCLVLLQNAAKQGTKALEEAWTNELNKADRRACSKYMNDLKRKAQGADYDKAGKEATKGRRDSRQDDSNDVPERREAG